MADNKKSILKRGRNGSEPEGPATSSDNELEMFTAKDLEGLSKIDVKTLYGYVNRALIPYVKIESNVGFPKQRIFDWIEQRTHLPKSVAKHTPGER